MRSSVLAAIAVSCIVAVPAAAPGQDWHQGRGRIEGVLQNAKGEPIAGATVSLRLNGAGTELKTDKSGRWAMLGLTGGAWEIDFSAPGYQSRKISVTLSEVNRNPPIKAQLEAEAPPAAQAAPQTEVRVGGKAISKDAAAALERGNAAMKAKNYAEAEENFEKVLGELPQEPALLFPLALTYYFDNKPDRALDYARKTVAVDPQRTDAWLMISELELQKGNLEAGQEALGKVPAERITSPEPFLDIGILSYNKKKYPEAEEAFTKAISMKADMAQAYYYRGLARFAAKRMADAKADLQKFVELSPTGSDADSAKEILKSIK